MLLDFLLSAELSATKDCYRALVLGIVDILKVLARQEGGVSVQGTALVCYCWYVLFLFVTILWFWFSTCLIKPLKD